MLDLYRKLLPAFLGGDVPGESLATCSDCAMGRPAGAVDEGGLYFSVAKCCTYHPDLPNYLVGAILRGTDPAFEEGRARIRGRIAADVEVMPRGISCPRGAALLMKQARGDSFGRLDNIICPYYDGEGGGCTVWPFRNAVCSTWFCKHAAGRDGMVFWRSLKRYLSRAEEALALHLLREMRMVTEPFPAAAGERADGTPSREEHERAWGEWEGREEEFYVRCFHLAEGLAPEEFALIAGDGREDLLADLRGAHRNLLSTAIPPVLRRNPDLKAERMDEETWRIVSFSPLQPLELSQRLYEMLDHFDGVRTNDEVRRTLLEKTGAEPEANLLLSLYRFRILVD